MHRPLVPDSLAPPAANYAHGVLVQDAQRWIHTAGVVPVARDGTVPEDLEAQAAVLWSNVAAILAEGGMGADDVVSVTTYVIAGAMDAGLPAAMRARDRFLGGRLVASTLVTVPALAQPAWKIEVAVVAAR